MFVAQESEARTLEFFEERFPDAKAIADLSAGLFEAFNRNRMKVSQLIRPRLIWRTLKALTKGHFIGKPGPDVLRLPGAFLVEAGRVVWSKPAVDPSDHANCADLLAREVSAEA